MPLNISPTQSAFNARGDGRFNVPFAQQVQFLRDKLNLPTAHFDDILKSAHDRAFVVAGALKADLLTDLHEAVIRSAEEGKSIQWFRKNFEEIVRKRGWEGWTGSDTKAGRDWRARIIYQTNLTTSYAAGRWSQLNDPDLIKLRPYWKYIHNDNVQHPRPLHVSWSGLVLKHDDSWWKTHFPPNGWGCRCRVTAVSAREYDGDTAPDDGVRMVKDRFGQTHRVPNGIDYGWDYAPGSSLLPRNLSKKVMDEWRDAKSDAWDTLTRGNWQSLGRPESVPSDPTTISQGQRLTTKADTIDAIRGALGADSKVYSVGGDFNYPVMVDAATLGDHIDPARAEYLPYLYDLLTDPFEIWAMIQQHKGTGKTEFRVRVIKRISTGRNEGMILVAQANKGQLEAWTFIPSRDLKYLNRQREGVLIYAR